jgi:multidrug resistance efflux pump
MKNLYVVWALLLVAVAAITLRFRGESSHFYGIADASEIGINLENAVEIKRIHVVQGQVIAAGDTLVELSRPELTLSINDISHQLDELRAKKHASAAASRSQIRQLKAVQETKINAIKSEIQQLEAQYAMNRKLAAELKSIKNDGTGTPVDAANNPVLLKIESLRKELELALHPSQIEIDMLSSGLSSTDGDPVLIQAQRLENELMLLNEGQKKLLIFAPISGIVGSVNFKEGEKVSPFTPVMTLHTKSPSYVKGYIHENVYNKIAAGDTVTIYSISESGHRIRGEVVGVGSRIVEYPARLRRRPEIQIWGREVVIKIPHDNEFLLGEKVRIASRRF